MTRFFLPLLLSGMALAQSPAPAAPQDPIDELPAKDEIYLLKSRNATLQAKVDSLTREANQAQIELAAYQEIAALRKDSARKAEAKPKADQPTKK